MDIQIVSRKELCNMFNITKTTARFWEVCGLVRRIENRPAKYVVDQATLERLLSHYRANKLALPPILEEYLKQHR